MPEQQKKASRIDVRLEPELRKQALEKAERQGHTLSDVIRRLLKKWLKGEVDVNDR